jgi:hypothetical protein
VPSFPLLRIILVAVFKSVCFGIYKDTRISNTDVANEIGRGTSIIAMIAMRAFEIFKL